MESLKELAALLSDICSSVILKRSNLDDCVTTLEENGILLDEKNFEKKVEEIFPILKEKIEEFTGKKTAARLEVNKDFGHLESYIKHFPFSDEENKWHFLRLRDIFKRLSKSYLHNIRDEIEELLRNNTPYTFLSLFLSLFKVMSTKGEYFPDDFISLNYSSIRRETAVFFLSGNIPYNPRYFSILEESFIKDVVAEEIAHSCLKKLMLNFYNLTSKELSLQYKIGKKSMNFLNELIVGLKESLLPLVESLTQSYGTIIPIPFAPQIKECDEFKKLQQIMKQRSIIIKVSKGSAYFIKKTILKEDPYHSICRSIKREFNKFFEECYEKIGQNFFTIIESYYPTEEEFLNPSLYLQRVKRNKF